MADVFDLGALIADLRAQEGPWKEGRRQRKVFHRAPVARILFVFEAGGSLQRHNARGEVAIHVLEGHLRVEVEDEEHELGAGQVLILEPEVPHEVIASESSAMLLTVHVTGGEYKS
jgi:quercetin dioxygenase-like cupin family protein